MRAFLEAHAALILRLARAHVFRGDRVEAEDIAHEAMVSLLRAAERGALSEDRLENAEAYLRVVVRHAAQRARSRTTKEDPLEDDGASIEDRAPTPEARTSEAIDARKKLERIKAKLRPRDALAFALLVEDGLDIEEVARAMGVTANHVYQMRHRILRAADEVREDADAVMPHEEHS